MTERKVARRSLTIALGALCIILMVAIGVLAFTLNSSAVQYNEYVSTHNHTDYDFNVVNDSLYNAIDGLGRLTSILDLENSTTYYSNVQVQLPANFSTEPNLGEHGLDSTPPFPQYAGVVFVQIISSTSNDVYVNVTYANSKIFVPEFRYTSETDVGTNGTVAFPAVPADFVDIRIGVRNAAENACANVTITYRY